MLPATLLLLMLLAPPLAMAAQELGAPDHIKVDTYGKPYLHTFLVGN